MTGEEIGTLLLAAVAVSGSIGSVLLLAFRVGKLEGARSEQMRNSEVDRQNMWKSLGALTGRFNRHIERPHGGVQ